jgi:uncharacterized protein (TIGR02246 family)
VKREDVSGLVDEIEAAWNDHDMSRFAACFAADADFVNVAGAWWRGREEIEERHAASHADRFKNSTMRLELAAFKEVGPEIGVMHVRWLLDGHGVSGPTRTTETRRGIWSWAVRRHDGKLEIVSSHNTDVLATPPAG